MVKIILDKDFATRTELDDFVRSRFGTDTKENSKNVIEATTEQREKLAISEDTTVHGMRVVKAAEAATPTATPAKK